MSHKGKRAYSKLISANMEAEEVQPDTTRKVRSEQMSVLVETIKSIISQEFRKLEIEFCNFKSDVCNSVETIQRKADARLTLIEQKIDTLEKSQQEFNLKKKLAQLKAQITEADKKENML